MATSPAVVPEEKVRIMSIDYGSFTPMKCQQCPNFAPMWTINCFVENAIVDGAFGKKTRRNFYKKLFVCAPCKDKFRRLWERK